MSATLRCNFTAWLANNRKQVRIVVAVVVVAIALGWYSDTQLAPLLFTRTAPDVVSSRAPTSGGLTFIATSFPISTSGQFTLAFHYPHHWAKSRDLIAREPGAVFGVWLHMPKHVSVDRLTVTLRGSDGETLPWRAHAAVGDNGDEYAFIGIPCGYSAACAQISVCISSQRAVQMWTLRNIPRPVANHRSDPVVKIRSVTAVERTDGRLVLTVKPPAPSKAEAWNTSIAAVSSNGNLLPFSQNPPSDFALHTGDATAATAVVPPGFGDRRKLRINLTLTPCHIIDSKGHIDDVRMVRLAAPHDPSNISYAIAGTRKAVLPNHVALFLPAQQQVCDPLPCSPRRGFPVVFLTRTPSKQFVWPFGADTAPRYAIRATGWAPRPKEDTGTMSVLVRKITPMAPKKVAFDVVTPVYARLAVDSRSQRGYTDSNGSNSPERPVEKTGTR